MSESDKTNIIDTILELKEQDPFVSFRIVVTGGTRYLIDTPGNLVELKSEFFYARRGGESFVLIRKNQIAAVERPEEKRSSRRKAS
jgi:hypothetical protein